jgi:hypothetical protein
MKEIAIKELGDFKELDNFIDETNDKAMTIKGIVVASDGDIKSISADIKELKQREDILKIAEGRLIKLAGIDKVGHTIENSREQRLLANKNVQNAKQEIKNKALDFFISNADDLIKNSQASDTYKQTFDTKQMASDAISGKSKDLMDLMKTELGNLELRLDNNARETSEKLAIIKQYDDDMARDKEYLLKLPVDVLKETLNQRKIAQDQKVKYKAQKLADAIEAERLAKIKIETEKLEAEIELDRLTKIKAEKIEAERLESERFAKLAKLDEKIGAEDKARAEKEAKIKFEIEITTLTDPEPFIYKFNGAITFNVNPMENRIIFMNNKNEIVKDIHFKFKIDSIKLKA